MVWDIDWWTALGWVGFGIGLMVALWALLWDRARGRLRCPKCWYDMSAPAPGSEDGNKDTGARGFLSICPECGRRVKREKELRKTRRRWKWAALALVVACLALPWHGLQDVRERGVIAMMPSPLLVVLAPVDEQIDYRRSGSTGADMTLGKRLLKELMVRSGSGNLTVLEARLMVWRAQRRSAGYFEELLKYRLPQVVGGQTAVGAFKYSSSQGLDSSLASRTRIVGRQPTEWYYSCDCTYDSSYNPSTDILVIEESEEGRYIVEREYYLPASMPRSMRWTRTAPGARVFKPSRLLHTVRMEIVVDESLVLGMTAFDEPGHGEKLAKALEPVIGIDPRRGGVWYLLRDLDKPILDAPSCVMYGLSVEIMKNGETIGTGTRRISDPSCGPIHTSRNNDYIMYENLFVPVQPIAIGDRVTIVLRGDKRIAGRTPTRIEQYWSGEITIPDVEVAALPGNIPVYSILASYSGMTWYERVEPLAKSGCDVERVRDGRVPGR